MISIAGWIDLQNDERHLIIAIVTLTMPGHIAYIIETRKCQGPGGPHGLQNQCTGDELVGGFDSHALPPTFKIQ